MKRTLISSILIVCAAACLWAQVDLQPVAVVNLIRSEPITVRQLRTEISRLDPDQLTAYRMQLTSSLGRQPTDAEFNQRLRREVLDSMINERLFLQAAERDRVFVTDNEINSQVQELRNNLIQQYFQAYGRQPDTAEVDAMYAQAVRNEYDMDVAEFREYMRRQLTLQKYLLTRKGDQLNAVRVPTDAEIVSFYELNRAQFYRPETVRITMIHIPFDSTAASRTNARAVADRLVADIGTNVSRFDEAVLRSIAPNSGYEAGDFGYVPRIQEARDAFGANFFDTLFNMNQGQVSPLLETAQGYHIVKVTEKYSYTSLGLDDLAQLGTAITVRQYIGQGLYSQRQQEALAQATQEIIDELRTSRTFTIYENNLNF